METRTTVYLTKKNKMLIDQNIPNFSEWVNTKIASEFNSLESLKKKEGDLVLDMSVLRDQITEKETNYLIITKKKEAEMEILRQNEEKNTKIQEKLQDLMLKGVKMIEKSGTKDTEEMVLILDKIKTKEKDLEVQSLFNKKYLEIMETAVPTEKDGENDSHNPKKKDT